MSINKDVEVLKRIPLFANFELSKLKLLAFAAERMVFSPGQVICYQGDVGEEAYVILSGEADILVDSDQGPIVVAHVGRNAIIGEIAVLINVPRTATVTATSEVATLKITKDLFFKMIREFPSMSVEVMRELAHRLDQTTRNLTKTRAELKRMQG